MPEEAKRKTIEIFCCYAREDQRLLLRLKRHLTPLQREGLITLWADVNINAGTEWEKEIDRHLRTARIILLLISPDFMASEYCYSVEMQRAIERHECGEARVLPIIVRPVSWHHAPFSKLQVLPANANPIVGGKWHHQDEALYAVAEGIRVVVETVAKDNPASQMHSPDQAGEAIAVEINTPSPQRQANTQPTTSPTPNEQALPYGRSASSSTEIAPLGVLTSQQTRRRLLSRIRYAWAFFGGLVVQAADLTWIAIISQQGANGRYLVNSDPYLNELTVFIFFFIIILDVLLTINGMIIMSRLKRRGWFIGLLLGSISGAAVLFLPGLALMVFGLFAPRTPASPVLAHSSDQKE